PALQNALSTIRKDLIFRYSITNDTVKGKSNNFFTRWLVKSFLFPTSVSPQYDDASPLSSCKLSDGLPFKCDDPEKRLLPSDEENSSVFFERKSSNLAWMPVPPATPPATYNGATSSEY